MVIATVGEEITFDFINSKDFDTCYWDFSLMAGERINLKVKTDEENPDKPNR
jgi:hypothetical protein